MTKGGSYLKIWFLRAVTVLWELRILLILGCLLANIKLLGASSEDDLMFLHSAADHSGEKVDQWFVRSGVVDAGEVNALLDCRASVSEGVLRDAGWSPVQVPGAVENS